MRLPFVSAFRKAASGPGEVKGGVPLAALSGVLKAGWPGRDYAGLARHGFMRNPVAHRAVRLVAEAAANVPLLLYEGERELSGHPVLALLQRPNPRQAGPDFLEALYGHLLLSGNAYVEPVRLGAEIRELYLLRPDRVSVAEGRDGWPVAYLVQSAQGTRRIPVRDGALLHLKLFHPLDDHLGFAPLAAAEMALELSNAAATWNKALLDNSARPSGALVYQPKEGGNLSPQQYERLKQELEDGYSGAIRAGRPLLLEGGLDWKAMGLTPRDMDFTEAKNGAARDIALSLGVPPMLLGIPGDNTYANYQEANRAFYRLTVLPLLTRTAMALGAFLAGEAALRLEPDLDQVAGLATERDQLWTRVGAAGFLSDAEKREAVGYGPQASDG
nr:phage portal protein [uncultured Gellertiella sp.]